MIATSRAIKKIGGSANSSRICAYFVASTSFMLAAMPSAFTPANCENPFHPCRSRSSSIGTGVPSAFGPWSSTSTQPGLEIALVIDFRYLRFLRAMARSFQLAPDTKHALTRAALAFPRARRRVPAPVVRGTASAGPSIQNRTRVVFGGLSVRQGRTNEAVLSVPGDFPRAVCWGIRSRTKRQFRGLGCQGRSRQTLTWLQA